MNLVGFTIEMYYDARPYERQMHILYMIRNNVIQNDKHFTIQKRIRKCQEPNVESKIVFFFYTYEGSDTYVCHVV